MLRKLFALYQPIRIPQHGEVIEITSSDSINLLGIIGIVQASNKGFLKIQSGNKLTVISTTKNKLKYKTGKRQYKYN